VGNEGGLAREDEWSVVPVKDSGNGSVDYALRYDAPDQGSRDALAQSRSVAQYLQWWPAECDVSIRPGWFYHADQQPKSVDQLADIWFRSVGRNSVLLLNIPPDTDGLLPAADVARLKEFRERIDRELPEDLADGARVRDDGEGTRTVDLLTAREVDRIRLAEDIRHGQQVEQFVVEAKSGGAWTEVARAGTIGASRVLVLPAPVTAREWRLRNTQTRTGPHIARFGLYRSRV
jgi:alpha-L-fucosidase